MPCSGRTLQASLRWSIIVAWWKHLSVSSRIVAKYLKNCFVNCVWVLFLRFCWSAKEQERANRRILLPNQNYWYAIPTVASEPLYHWRFVSAELQTRLKFPNSGIHHWIHVTSNPQIYAAKYNVDHKCLIFNGSPEVLSCRYLFLHTFHYFCKPHLSKSTRCSIPAQTRYV